MGEAGDELAIRISGLSKVYDIYERPEDRLKQMLLPRLRSMAGFAPRRYYREFWALQDISLEINKGETVGIIGRNGSGKSTLLQLVCKTLSPSLGAVTTQGRIAALLELGSGFNPEFTGRENVYINAAILGLTKAEVDERFDLIAEFADIGEFIDQPVKAYSSGMMVRLAFAVIAHVDADILVVDEALSVGDAIFNQKCMRFIRAFQEHGTLLFVSHDMAAIQSLCGKAIWLADGRVQEVGESAVVAEHYLKYTLQADYGDSEQLINTNGSACSEAEETAGAAAADDSKKTARGRANLASAKGWKTGKAELTDVRIEQSGGGKSGFFRGGESINVTIKAVAHERLVNPILGFLVKDRLGQDLFGENTLPFSTDHCVQIEPGQRFKAEFEFTLPLLPNGQYVVTASVADGNLQTNVQHHYLHDASVFNVASDRVRWGLVGIEFQSVFMEVMHD